MIFRESDFWNDTYIHTYFLEKLEIHWNYKIFSQFYGQKVTLVAAHVILFLAFPKTY